MSTVTAEAGVATKAPAPLVNGRLSDTVEHVATLDDAGWYRSAAGHSSLRLHWGIGTPDGIQTVLQFITPEGEGWQRSESEKVLDALGLDDERDIPTDGLGTEVYITVGYRNDDLKVRKVRGLEGDPKTCRRYVPRSK